MLVVFEATLLRELGFRPNLNNCLNCGRELEPERNAFDLDGGGIVCERCTVTSYGSRPIGVNALKLYRMIDRGELARVLRLRLDAATVDELDRLLEAYAQRIAGREFLSRRVVSDLKLQYQATAASHHEGDKLDGVHR